MSNHRRHGFRFFARAVLSAALACFLLSLSSQPKAAGQGYDRIARARAKKMLEQIAGAIEKKYYDEGYRGIDLQAHFGAAQKKLDDATSVNHAFRIIAQALLDFDDSHTFFLPPGLAVSADYGWRMRMVGDECYVSAVRPGSDAEARGLRRGDQLLALEGFKPTRGDFWKLKYLFQTLAPMRSMAVEVQGPGERPRRLQIASKVTQRRRVIDLTGADGGFDVDALIREADDELAAHLFAKAGDAVVWKMPSFNLSRDEIDRFLGQHLEPASALVLDLRGNGGGYVSTLEELTGRFFQREVKIADVKGRKAEKSIIARTRKGRQLSGRLVVLIDAGSGSAAELFARVVQLEQRGVVIGDRSAGAVMRSEVFSGALGTDRVVPFAASITTADLIMADGHSLERRGVVPEELILPTAADLAAGRDPVLARAVAIAGASLTPEAAGGLFKVEWR